MGGAHGRRRDAVALGALLAGFLLAVCPHALALNPALDINQYAHTAWKIREGFSKGTIVAITQTSDGYLWLGTEFGLLRFDGVRYHPWQPPAGQELPSSYIRSVLASRDGTLWIGTAKGLASWKTGKLTHYPNLAGQSIWALLEDREGTIWAGGQSTPTGRLCAVRASGVQCYGEDGAFGQFIDTLHEDSRGNLWVGGVAGLWRWKPGSPQHYPMPDRVQALMEGNDGALVVVMYSGIKQLVDGKLIPYPFPPNASPFTPREMFRDRQGSLWIGTTDGGLVHIHNGRTDMFERSDGLSGDFVEKIFEDREGNIWVATIDGLDRFRDIAVSTLSVKQGLSNATVVSVLVARDGAVWLGTLNGLNRWNQGEVTVYRKGTSGLPDDSIESLYEDDQKRIWAATNRGLAFFEKGRFTPVESVPGEVKSISGDRAGNVWISQWRTLFQVRGGRVVARFPWAGFGRKEPARAMVPDPRGDGIWLAFLDGDVGYFDGSQLRVVYTKAAGLGAGNTRDLYLDRDSVLWAATEGGLSRLKDGRIATLNSRNGLPCDDVHWVMEDDLKFYWIYMACGLVRTTRAEMEAWAATASTDPHRRVAATVFDGFDGIRSHTHTTGFSPNAGKSLDGRLWFLPWDGVSVVDPRNIPFNKLPPPVHIENITVDHKSYEVVSAKGPLELPPHVRDLEIDYTALSLVAPEKVLFRYKLEGWDNEWQDAGNRRQAFYTNLSPRSYRFRLMACNNSGVWNDAGTFLDFTVAPAYYQTTWFHVSCVAAFLAVLAVLYRLRLRQVAHEFNMRLEERVNERTRIARDLHDTLLQGFQGVLLKFHAITYLLPDRPADARKTLEAVIEQARQAITDGRDAVQGLRSSTVATTDVAQAISALGEDLAASLPGNAPYFAVQVEGETRDLAPLVRDDTYRIAGEALRNSFRHAQATRIEVEIRYDNSQLRVRLRDDGKGIDQNVLDGGGRSGHYGLPGMHERAKLVGGKLVIWSELNSGTEIELTIPAAVAYAKATIAR
jgi:signal transduction histidine kinase/ligand-binding sensor domain-containing protein